MNLALWLERVAQVRGEASALMRGGEVVADYAGFHARAAALGRALEEAGVAPGDRVAIWMRNAPEYLVALFGIWIAGAAAVPVNAKLHAREAAWILGNAGARLAFVSPELGTALAAESDVAQVVAPGPEFAAMCEGRGGAVVERAPGDLAWLFYTSGTTGRPKGVCITHGMLMATSLAYPVDVDMVQPQDAALYAAPMSHGAGLYELIHVLKGARHLVPASGGFDPAEVLELARDHGPVSMFLAPTMVRRLTDAAKKAGSPGEGIRTIVYGGGPMYRADIEEALDVFGPVFVQIYGQGECPMAISALSREDVANRAHPRRAEIIGSVGRAQSVVEVAVGDAEGRALPVGETGEIMVRGLPVMPGYWQNAEATAKTLRGGWLMTGDVGRLDAQGYLTLVDRSKDVIISGGSNIYPREVEEVLLTHPGVHEVSVVGRPSAEWGEEVVAFVVPEADWAPDAAALDAHCLAAIARFKRPKAYLFVDELPKNNYGKVLKTVLRERLAAMAREAEQ
ncbi:long-chain acyl-CoA synthetase [Meinhardsimonia xiamenensis]|jgi:long-chain acyl-CoA synthetase|uniref:3-methylmercaptopropionyl-CoA ligase n=1 Tax=Meinhardsimonia xiamenensis TaxID=990712 RepID=A0A1G8YW02_9RHOB|nr:AMP-binding protein [Meinhardsimonia xiamenensis]PRX37457.1 long-chain acyl-CoA synthetase [Meinhardsimonia xiamenensis]SDK06953.1 long-chain acyl-CoA synthetase [Meinhardsimonia xiamenensis]